MPTAAVFFGGRSSEAEISVITGMYAVNLLRGTRWKVLPVFWTREGTFLLGAWRKVSEFASPVRGTPVLLHGGGLVRLGRKKPLYRVDAALNCCHGGMGEDGTLSALLAYAGIPSASPAAAESAVFLDKTLSKIVARGLGIPAAPSFTLTEEAYARRPAAADEGAEELGYPLVVKPARLGSSIGLTVVHGAEELGEALRLAFRLDGKALLERYFAGKRDINCAAYMCKGEIVTSPCEEVFSGGELLSYDEKYLCGAGAQLPARLPEETAERIAAYTRRIYAAFGMHGVVRADFFVVGEEVYFNELNTVPGSLAAYLFADTLTGVRGFLVGLLEEGLRAPAPKETLRTGILSDAVFTGAKGCKRRGNQI